MEEKRSFTPTRLLERFDLINGLNLMFWRIEIYEEENYNYQFQRGKSWNSDDFSSGEILVSAWFKNVVPIANEKNESYFPTKN